MFDLKLTNSELSGSTCAVSWCVDEETLKYLSDNNINDPQVVLVVAPEGRRYHSSREYRKVVPLKDLMAYVEFRTSGPNKIWGFISNFNKSGAKDYYLSRRNGEFKTDVLNNDGSEYDREFSPSFNDGNRMTVSQPQPVIVPVGVFASEPWEWEKTWVNHFFREKPIDQCDFRRRRLFAYGLQPLIMLASIIVRLTLFVCGLLIGARNLSLQPTLHPLRINMNDALAVAFGGSIFIRHLREDDYGNWTPRPMEVLWYGIRSFWLLPLMPPILTLLVLLTVHHAWVPLTMISAIAILFAIIACIIAYFVSGAFRDTINWFYSLKNIKAIKDEVPWYLDQEEIDLLTCKPDRKAFDFKSLPARKKTMYLRYQDLKSKLCRPFSA